MSQYFINGKEVSKEEAEKVLIENQKILSTNNLHDLLSIKFIIKQ